MKPLRIITLLFFVMSAFALTASAQVDVTGSTGADGSYTTLSAAFAAINAGSQTGNTIAISITGDTAEPAGGAILNAGTWTSITVSPSGGAARTITGAVTAGLPLIDLNGADNITFNGLNTGGNALTISNTTVSSTSGTATIRFQADAVSNTVTNCSILGSSTTSAGTSGGNILFFTATSTGNDNNIISNNNIGPVGTNLPTKTISGNGTSGFTNSGIQITGNNIFDYFNAAATSHGIYISTGNTDWTITGNKFYQTDVRTQTTGAIHAAIQIASGNVNNCNISNNTIGYASANATGTYTFVGSDSGSKFLPIYFSTAGITTASSIQGNTITAISASGIVGGAGSTAAFNGISIASGIANIGNLTGNTIGSLTMPGAISVTSNNGSAMDVNGIYYIVSAAANISNNNIGGITVSNSGAGDLDVYGIRAVTTASVTNTMVNNTIGSTPAGISSSNAGTGANLYGLVCQTGRCTVTGNTIRNLTTDVPNTGTGASASAIGLFITNTTATAGNNISTNTIDNFTNTNATAMVTITGLHYNGSTSGTHLVQRNFINAVSAANTSGAAIVNGINIQAGATTYRNNMVIIGNEMTNSPQINGINETGGTDNLYFNSVYVGGAPTSGTSNSFAFQSSVTTNTRIYRDNIFFNARSNSGGTGKHYAVRVGGTAPNPAGLTSNNNDLFVSGMGGFVGLFNNIDQTLLSDWQTATGQDAASLSVDPLFVSTVNLHLTMASPVRDQAFDVGVTNDFDNKVRPGANALFDIGADEFDGTVLIANDLQATAFIDPTDGGVKLVGSTFAPQASFTNNGISAQTSVTVRYRICTDGTCTTELYNNTAIIASIAPSATTTVTFPNASIGATGTYTIKTRAELGTDTVPANDEITGTFAVSNSLSGTYTVGAGGNFSSLTNSGGVFQAINNLGATSNLTIEIISNLTSETGANALNNVAGGFTVLLKPTSAARIVSGTAASTALIRLNGASNITIDGSLSGGTDRSLTIENTSAITPQVVRFGSIGTTPVINNTLKNCIIRNGANTNPAITILNTAGVTAGYFNNLTVQNNDVQNASVGIFANAATATGNGSGLLITQNNLNASGLNAIKNVGVLVQGADGAAISNNTIGNFSASEAENDTGIWLATGTGNTIVSGNTVTNLGYSGTNTFAPFGIRDGAGLALSNNNLTGNTVSNISTNGQEAVIGIENSSGGTIIEKNNVSNVSNTNPDTFGAYGINISAGNGVVVRNNFVSDVKFNMTGGLAFSEIFGVFGIRVGDGSLHRIYHNSVNLYGALSGTANDQLLTAAFGIVNTTSTGMDVRNNVFSNKITGGAFFIAHVSVYLPSGGTSAMNLTMNKNAYFFGTDASRQGTGQAGTTAGMNFYTSLAALAGYSSTLHAAATNDNASQAYTSAVPFVSNGDLHLSSPTSPLIGAGDAIGSVTNDCDMDPRPALNPDIGADELVQAEAGTIPAGTFYNAIAANGDMLGGNVTVTNSLTLNGIVGTGANTLTLGCSATVSGANATNFVVGNVAKQFCAVGAFTYPVGDNTGTAEYSPFTANVTALGIVPSTLTVSVTDNFFPDGMSPTESASRYWTVTENGDLTANISFTYLDADINGAETTYQVLRRSGSITEIYPDPSNPGGTGSVNPATNTATATNVMNFSQWGAGNLVPLAAVVNIGGRVLRADGQGIPNARLILTDSNGATRILMTNAFGYYNFEDVEGGQTVTISVSHKQFSFASPTQIINVGESLDNVNFIAAGENNLLERNPRLFR